MLALTTLISSAYCTKATEGMSMKSIRDVISHTQRHWVGDGFHVIPVFANKAFTNDMSPFLMFDYAAPKEFSPTKKRLGVGQHLTEDSRQSRLLSKDRSSMPTRREIAV